MLLGKKDPETGCRPDQLFGVWALEPTQLQQLAALACGADLTALRAEARAMAAERGQQPLYSMQDRLAVIEVSGPMTKYSTSFQALTGGTSTLRTREALRAAVRDPEVLGIMVVIDSPGGTISGTSDLADDIRAAAARKPVHAYAADLMASAALWVGVAAQRITANKTAAIGSIGVYSVVYDTSGRYAQAGVRVHVVSSAPPIKGAGVEGTPIEPAQLAEWERQIKDLAALFKAEVARDRRLKSEQMDGLATGQVWVAEQARELGLIDGVGSLQEALQALRKESMSAEDTKAALDLATEAQATAELEKAARLKVEAESAELKKKLAALETAERAKRFGAEAEALGAPKEFAAVLDKLEAACGAELYGAVQAQMKAFAEQVKAGDLFKQSGRDGAPSKGDAYEKLQAIAKDIVAQGETKDQFKALALAAQRNPELAAAARPGSKEA